MSRNVFFSPHPFISPFLVTYCAVVRVLHHFQYFFLCRSTFSPPLAPPPPSSTLIFKVFSSLHYFLLPSFLAAKWIEKLFENRVSQGRRRREGGKKVEKRGDVPMLPPFSLFKGFFFALDFFFLLPPKMNWALEERKRKGGLHASAEKYVIPRSLSLSLSLSLSNLRWRICR